MSVDADVFRSSFKYFKRKVPVPDFSEVIDFRSASAATGLIQIPRISRVQLIESELPLPVCLSPVNAWNAYSLQDHPGFYFIANPFINCYERYWVKRCLEDYTQPPNHSNLDALVGQSTWKNVWKSSLSEHSEHRSLMDRLHWVTLGMHHNWDTKEYSIDDRDTLPLDLNILTRFIARTLGFANYIPEAAILNYYHIGSTLGGHTDHSELNHDAPVISLSFGCSAVFLIGGHSKGIRPEAMFVDSGDILVLSGESRLSYHAVPRIMSDAERLSSCRVVTRDIHGSGGMTVVGDVRIVLERKKFSAVGAGGVIHENTEMHCHCDLTSGLKPEWVTGNREHIFPLQHCCDSCLSALMLELNTNMNQVLGTLSWTQFHQFLNKRRINLNVRQVF